MKKSMITLLVGICMAGLLASGCANKEAVKKEEAVVPAAAAAATPATEAAKPVEEQKAVEKAPETKAAVQPVQEEVVKAAAQEVQPQTTLETSLETVYFDFDKSDLRQDTRDVLAKDADIILKSLANAKIQIAGHTDERGSAEYNLALGERRAKSAQKYLVTLGVKDANLSTISYGKEKPAVQGSNEAAWAKNRRAEFSVSK